MKFLSKLEITESKQYIPEESWRHMPGSFRVFFKAQFYGLLFKSIFDTALHFSMLCLQYAKCAVDRLNEAKFEMYCF